MEQQFAEAQYEGEWNWLEDDYLVWNRIGVSADRTTPGSVASYLRCGGHISDRVLRQLIWQGRALRHDSEETQRHRPTFYLLIFSTNSRSGGALISSVL